MTIQATPFSREPAKLRSILTGRELIEIKRCSQQYQSSPLLVAITHKNQFESLDRAVLSVYKQKAFQENLVQIVILDDQSDHDMLNLISTTYCHPAITILSAHCGSPSSARNLLLDWADDEPQISWIARLDADDELAHADSLMAIWRRAEETQSVAVIGSNYLRLNDEVLSPVNRPNPRWLNDQASLVSFVEDFCFGRSTQELPSCNLLLKNREGFRYPNVRSAEDHWLIVRLLLLHSKKVSLLLEPVYAIYTLNGNETTGNINRSLWSTSRGKLATLVRWAYEGSTNGQILIGFGMEGIVTKSDDILLKRYFPWAMDSRHVTRIRKLTSNPTLPIPQGNWTHHDGVWHFASVWTNYQPIGKTVAHQLIFEFLSKFYRSGVAPLNIKRDNLMIHPDGALHYIDIGKDIVELSSTKFLDVCARLYSIGILGNSDDEWIRRRSLKKQDEVLSALPGFTDFYRNLMSALVGSLDESSQVSTIENLDVTLLIKACGQDSAGLYEQICHIVTQLEHPAKFAKKVLLVDSYKGPFLRQYAEIDLAGALKQANELLAKNIIDDVLIAPSTEAAMVSVYCRWFGQSNVTHAQTTDNAPLYHQLWGFEQVKTRYVLQCDCDVLIGRKNWSHDYLGEMLREFNSGDVECVGFNIPKATSVYLEYFGKPGQFAPEVRFGLLDLKTIFEQLPVSNPIVDGHFTLTWHRALQQNERCTQQLRSVRGGNPATFYVHPLNDDKHHLTSGIIRDLISQGIYPEIQAEQFDLQPSDEWKYPQRSESIIFLMKGRMTPHWKLDRCLTSLRHQTDQSFGMIVIDDASGFEHSWNYPLLLGDLFDKTTLVRHSFPNGRIPNFLLAIEKISVNPDALIVILDQDDFLMQSTIVSQLKAAVAKGHDVIQMPMYRPDKPLKIYCPEFEDCRKKVGANVWAHLGAFSKKLFLQVPLDYFRRPTGEWFDTVTDFVTMIPMVEIAKSPIFIDSGYAYWHERDPYETSHKEYQNVLIAEVLAKPRLEISVEPDAVVQTLSA